ncbi:MAG: hypothetical protein ACKV22_19775 [Bryobacteraceae bacterium]
MKQNPHARDATLFAAFAEAVSKALEYVRRRQAETQTISTHADWPELRWRENGMPSFSTKFNAPKDYADALLPTFGYLGSSTGEKKPEFTKEGAFLRLMECLRANPRTAQHCRADLRIFEAHVRVLVGSLTDRYVHVNLTTDFTAQAFVPIYIPLEAVLLCERLSAAFLVPILFLKPACRHFAIGGGVQVVRMSEHIQLARAPRDRPGEHPAVQSCATHALALSVYTFQNDDWLDLGYAISDPQVYPLRLIDAFFASVRIVTGFDTGYAQLLTRPIGWASRYRASLPPLEGTTTRNYPPSLEKFRWNETIPVLHSSQLQEIAHLFIRLRQLLESGSHPRLQLAVQRLNSCALRVGDEDGIIDSAIGLEALLSDGSQEMTYKVGMRMAALALVSGHPNPSAVLAEMKAVYNFRSAVVHGDVSHLSKRRTLQREAHSVSTAQVAMEYLRLAIRVVAEHPEYLNVKSIDEGVLLRAHPLPLSPRLGSPLQALIAQ